MTTLQETIEDMKHTAQQMGGRMERRAAAQAAKGLVKQQAATAALLARQQKELQLLQREVEGLRKQRSGGGFPWMLVLLAGGGYALYRSNPAFRDQVQGLLKRVNPGIEGNVTRAGDAVKEAVSNVSQGQSASGPLQTAGNEMRRAGEKAVEGARDTMQDMKRDAQANAGEVKRDLQNRNNRS